MGNLKYKARGNSSPHGKPRVYFCCHPEDFEVYFQSVTDEILAMQNCTVWYADRDTVRDEEFLADLRQIQLFVMPITKKLLSTPNDALDVEFGFAVKNHIPVLPLMQESGLEEEFNKKCGDLQFLDKHTVDETAIQYEEKLQNYLESVLVGDTIAEKIRASFDAYAFLSYRKKDRKYAQELMRLIHRNEFCRDIAIWYDEFLIPGENFNHSIEDALHKSDLFVLAVTPNLVNETNYIMTTEYPMARTEGKPILPAELVPTDRVQLSEKFDEIPDPADAYSEAELSEALLASFQHVATKENDSSPQHNYYIGLAYLSGIDVEVDYERAIQLITDAAECGLDEARQKLVDIYMIGIGVQRDYKKACEWKRISNQAFLDEVLKMFEEVKSRKNTIAEYIRELSNKLADSVDFLLLNDHQRALHFFEVSVKSSVKKWCEKQSELSDMYWISGDACAAEEVLMSTISFLSNQSEYDCTDIYGDTFFGEPNSQPVNTAFFDLHTKLIGYFMSEMKYSLAEEWQDKSCSWAKAVGDSYGAENLEAVQFMRYIDLMYARLLYRQGKYEAAKDVLNCSIDELVTFLKSPKPNTDDMQVSVDKNGEITILDEAAGLIMAIYMRRYAYMDYLSDAFMLLGDVYRALGMTKEAFDAYDEAVVGNRNAETKAKLSREIIGKLRMAEAASLLHDTDKSVQLLAEVENRLFSLKDSTAEMAVLKREYYTVAGEVASVNGDAEAAEYFDKAVEIAGELTRELPSVENLCCLAELCSKMYSLTNPSKQAQKYMDSMYEAAASGALRKASAKSQQARGDICFLIYKCSGDVQALKEAYDLFGELSARYPEEIRFAQKLEEIKRLL